MSEKDLANDPEFRPYLIRRFGVAYVIAVVSIILAGQLYLSNLDMVVKNRLGIGTAKPDTMKVEDLPTVPGKENPPIDVFTIGRTTPDQVAKGKALYNTTCASCHGEGGKGDGVAGGFLDPKPRDFTQSENWKNGRTVNGLYKTLQEGIPGGGMVAYDYLPIEDRFAMIHYLRTFAVDFPVPAQSELADLDATYKLSAGTKTAPQIPVKQAMAKLSVENELVAVQADAVMKLLKSDRRSAEASIFSSMSRDKRTALISLASSSSWMANESDFVAFVTSDPVQKGFRPSVVNSLSSGDWRALFNYLSGLISPLERG